MTISDEAVEAAMRSIYSKPGVVTESDVRRALKSAAPHFMAQALDAAADNFEVRSDTFLATMKSMTGLPEYTHDDILRYGAYSAEAQTAAIRLRSSAQAYRSAGAGE